MTDILIAMGLTASAALAIALIVANAPGSAGARWVLTLLLLGWFGLVVALGVAGALRPEYLGTLGVGALAVAPVVIVSYLALRVAALKRALLSIPVSILILIHVGRILGVTFLVLFAAGRLSAPFAPIAGWGDIVIGGSAIPVALFAARSFSTHRRLVLAWNALGLADLLVALALGITSAPDSPWPLFTHPPGTVEMSGLPMLIIPAFLVPLYSLVHLAIFNRLRRAASGEGSTQLSSRPTRPAAISRPQSTC